MLIYGLKLFLEKFGVILHNHAPKYIMYGADRGFGINSGFHLNLSLTMRSVLGYNLTIYVRLPGSHIHSASLIIDDGG